MSIKKTELLTHLESEVRSVDKPENRADYQKFFKEKLEEPVGLRTPVLRKISQKTFKEVHKQEKEEILQFCDFLLESTFRYRRFFAFDWAERLQKRMEPSDFARFNRWLHEYVDNWAACDHLCSPLGALIVSFPELSRRRRAWMRSNNLWVRRASAVSLIRAVRSGLLIHDVVETAVELLHDREDLVQKGYGWMLKEASAKDFERIYHFVVKHKQAMPRTALRYAIEKWPAGYRREALS